MPFSREIDGARGLLGRYLARFAFEVGAERRRAANSACFAVIAAAASETTSRETILYSVLAKAGSPGFGKNSLAALLGGECRGGW